MASMLKNENSLDSTYKKVNIRLIPFVFICYIFAYFARINVSFAKLQMLAELGWSETAYGLGAGIFFIGYVVFAVPSNICLAKVGARFWIGFLMVSWGIVSTALMYAKTPEQFYVLRFLTGVAEAGFFPGIVYYFTRWYPSERRGRVISLFMAAIPVSGVIGGPLSGWIMNTFTGNALGLAAWQWIYVIYGVPTILIGLSVYAILPNDFRSANFLDDWEKEMIAAEMKTQDEKHDGSQGKDSLMSFITTPMVWYFALIYFLIEMGEYALGFWMPTIIRSSGFENLETVGLLSAVAYFVAGVAMVYVGRSSDARKERRWHLVIPLWAGMFGLLVAALFSTNAFIAVTGLVIATAGVLVALPMFWTVPSAMLGAAAAAGGLAFINSIGNLAGFFSPYLVGWVKDVTNSTDVALYVISAAAFVGSILILRIPKNRLVQ